MSPNRKTAQAQRSKIFAKDTEPATAVEEIVIAEETTEEVESVDATDPLQEEPVSYRYPLNISKNYPARIIFTAYKVEGVDIGDKVGEAFSYLAKTAGQLLPGGSAGEKVTTAIADAKVDEAVKNQIIQDENQSKSSNKSYVNKQEIEVGSVILPLQRDLRFSDNAQYETASLGVFGGSLETGLRGGDPFKGATANGQLTSTVSALAGAAVAKGVGEVVGAAIGSVGGTAGALVGASALGSSFEGLSPAVRSASRISSAPNQRTLFQQVGIRSFSFSFKMIANNEDEAREVKNIIKFFRQELYPEKIPLGESGVPLAYKFPDVFEIEIKNRHGDNPAFKIQRCYLRDIQTSFNSTASGMYRDGSFIEAEISLSFQEIVALDKKKVKDENY